MQDDNSRLEDSELQRLIPAEIRNDEFHRLIQALSATEQLRHVLEIGSSCGEGSTDAFVTGLLQNANRPQLYCIEVSKTRFAVLKEHYKDAGFVHCYNGSSVRMDEFPTPETISDFYNGHDTALRNFGLPLVLSWLRQDIQYVREAGVRTDAIEQIKQEHGIDTFDMVLIDGSEFTGNVEFKKIYGASIILLDDTNSFKTYAAREALLADPHYELIAENQTLRNGYSVFRHRKSTWP